MCIWWWKTMLKATIAVLRRLTHLPLTLRLAGSVGGSNGRISGMAITMMKNLLTAIAMMKNVVMVRNQHCWKMTLWHSEISVVEKCPSVDQNRHAHEVSNICIPCQQTKWVMLAHPIADHFPQTKFRHCNPYRTLFAFFVIGKSEQIWNEVLNMCIRWQQTTWIVIVTTTTHIPNFVTDVAHTKLRIFAFLLLANQNRYANEVFNNICAFGDHRPRSKYLCLPLPTYQVYKNRSLRSH